MKLIIYIFLLFNPIISFGQTTFFNSYGGEGNDYGKSIITTIDTAYTIIGATESSGSGNTDMYLFKIDSLGNLLWSKTFGGSNIEWGMDLNQTIDTGYILTGYSNSQSWDYNIYVVKTDSIGDSIWTRTYGGNDWDFSYSIENTGRRTRPCTVCCFMIEKPGHRATGPSATGPSGQCAGPHVLCVIS